MDNLRLIRKRLGLTQKALGDGIGCTQGNVHLYETGQMMSAKRARRLIDFAAGLGLALTFDHLYGDAPLPELAQLAAHPEGSAHE